MIILLNTGSAVFFANSAAVSPLPWNRKRRGNGVLPSYFAGAVSRKSKAVTAAAIYCRISSDRKPDGESDEKPEGLGVQRQEALCRRLASERGWPVGEVYVDNDVSAFGGKKRPAYARMLA